MRFCRLASRVKVLRLVEIVAAVGFLRSRWFKDRIQFMEIYRYTFEAFGGGMLKRWTSSDFFPPRTLVFAADLQSRGSALAEGFAIAVVPVLSFSTGHGFSLDSSLFHNRAATTHAGNVLFFPLCHFAATLCFCHFLPQYKSDAAS